MARIDPVTVPDPGDVLTNEDIKRCFIVGNSGGMRRNRKGNLLVLISDPFKGMYQDRWHGDILHYTGMGPTGNQSLSYSQNRTLAQSPKSKISLHLLEALDPQKYTYVGEVDLVGAPFQEDQFDHTGQFRKVWMFPVKVKGGGKVPTPDEKQVRGIEESQAREARRLSTQELKQRARKAKTQPSVRNGQTTSCVRDAAVAEYVRRLANGICDLCETPAPFQNKAGEPYLESHHVIWLAKGGEDSITNTVALCANCHRKMHVLNDRHDREKLTRCAVSRAAHWFGRFSKRKRRASL